MMGTDGAIQMLFEFCQGNLDMLCFKLQMCVMIYDIFNITHKCYWWSVVTVPWMIFTMVEYYIKLNDWLKYSTNSLLNT